MPGDFLQEENLQGQLNCKKNLNFTSQLCMWFSWKNQSQLGTQKHKKGNKFWYIFTYRHISSCKVDNPHQLISILCCNNNILMTLTLAQLEAIGQLLRNILLFKQWQGTINALVSKDIFILTLTDIAWNELELIINTTPEMPSLREKFI